MRTKTSPGVCTRECNTLNSVDKQGFSSQQYPEKYNSNDLVDSLAIDYLRAASRERPDLIEHAHRVYGLVKAFAGDLMPDTRDAIMLHVSYPDSATQTENTAKNRATLLG